MEKATASRLSVQGLGFSLTVLLVFLIEFLVLMFIGGQDYNLPSPVTVALTNVVTFGVALWWSKHNIGEKLPGVDQ